MISKSYSQTSASFSIQDFILKLRYYYNILNNWIVISIVKWSGCSKGILDLFLVGDAWEYTPRILMHWRPTRKAMSPFLIVITHPLQVQRLQPKTKQIERRVCLKKTFFIFNFLLQKNYNILSAKLFCIYILSFLI